MSAHEQLTFRVSHLNEDEGGGFVAEIPELPGCRGDGETEEMALADAQDAMMEWIDEARRLGRPVPSIAQAYLTLLRRPAA